MKFSDVNFPLDLFLRFFAASEQHAANKSTNSTLFYQLLLLRVDT